MEYETARTSYSPYRYILYHRCPDLLTFGLTSVRTSSFILVSALLLIISTQFELLAEISLGPLKAKMRDTIREAEEIMEKLRRFAAASAKSSLTQMSMSNFWAQNAPWAEQFKMRDEVIGELHAIGLSKELIINCSGVLEQRHSCNVHE